MVTLARNLALILMLLAFGMMLALVLRLVVTNRLTIRRRRRRDRFITILAGLTGGRAKVPRDLRLWARDRQFLAALVELLPHVAGAQHDALLELAHEAGINERALGQIRSWRPRRRIRAISSLAAIADPASRSALENVLLNDPVLEVQIRAADGLAQLAVPESADVILVRMERAAPWAAIRMADSVVRFGPRAVPALSEYIVFREEWNVSALHSALLVEVLGLIGDPRAAFALTRAFEDDDVDIRASAVRALGRVGATTAVPLLLRATTDGQWPVRAQAASALAALQAVDAIPAIVGLLSDPAWWVRRNAARGLATLPGGIRELESVVSNHVDKFAREAAQDVLRSDVGASELIDLSALDAVVGNVALEAAT